MAQHARYLVMDLEDAGAVIAYLVRDRDAKFPARFGQILTDAGISTVRTGVPTPRMNSIMERWVQEVRYELLDRTLIWNQRHLLRALREFEEHHNRHRPNQAMNQSSPAPSSPRTDQRSGKDSLAGRTSARPLRRCHPRVPSSSLNCADVVSAGAAPAVFSCSSAGPVAVRSA
ncbi:MAG: integrase core domain-containing protein [Streptosporangiaceae bacterium]